MRIEQIADTQHPEDHALPASHGEAENEVRPFMRRRFHRWQDIQIEDVVRLSRALEWLSPAGLRYYLPALLSVVAASPEAAKALRSALLNELAAKIEAFNFGGKSYRFHETADILTPAQKEVIREFLTRRIRVDEGPYSYWSANA